MVIDVIDMTDHHEGDKVRSGLLGVDTTIIETMAIRSNGVVQMVSDILYKAGACFGRIDVLRIWGHGYPGAQGVSSGREIGWGCFDWNAICAENISGMRETLSRLRPYFNPGARVELRGCAIARKEEGEDLLIILAAIWGVRVYAGNWIQNGLNWTGLVYVATPSGQFYPTNGPAI